MWKITLCTHAPHSLLTAPDRALGVWSGRATAQWRVMLFLGGTSGLTVSCVLLSRQWKSTDHMTLACVRCENVCPSWLRRCFATVLVRTNYGPRDCRAQRLKSLYRRILHIPHVLFAIMCNIILNVRAFLFSVDYIDRTLVELALLVNRDHVGSVAIIFFCKFYILCISSYTPRWKAYTIRTSGASFSKCLSNGRPNSDVFDSSPSYGVRTTPLSKHFRNLKHIPSINVIAFEWF